MNRYDYFARVEQAVRSDLNSARCLTVIEAEVHEREDYEVELPKSKNVTKRTGYWERIYSVAWINQNECGTHRVCIDSEGKAMCVWGHFQMTADEAIADAIERSGKAALR
jgi:hypothetical protein